MRLQRGAAVARAKSLTPGARVERAAVGGIESERLDLLQSRPRLRRSRSRSCRRRRESGRPSSPPTASRRGAPGARARARVGTARPTSAARSSVAPRSSLRTTSPPPSSPASEAQSRPSTSGSATSAVDVVARKRRPRPERLPALPRVLRAVEVSARGAAVDDSGAKGSSAKARTSAPHTGGATTARRVRRRERCRRRRRREGEDQSRRDPPFPVHVHFVLYGLTRRRAVLG